MLRLLRFLSILPVRFFRSRRDLLLENLALRQQLTVVGRSHSQPRFAAADKLFWVTLRQLWPGCIFIIRSCIHPLDSFETS
jgi:hypothetical protein